jgi:hypothetical protein
MQTRKNMSSSKYGKICDFPKENFNFSSFLTVDTLSTKID